MLPWKENRKLIKALHNKILQLEEHVKALEEQNKQLDLLNKTKDVIVQAVLEAIRKKEQDSLKTPVS